VGVWITVNIGMAVGATYLIGIAALCTPAVIAVVRTWSAAESAGRARAR